MNRRALLTLLVMLFAAVYYVSRIAIGLMGLSGEMSFEEEQSDLVEGVVVASFLAIGVAGLLLLPGVHLRRPWGLWGTVAVGLYTIAFDAWALAAVQSSAGAGIVPAAFVTGYLLLIRGEFTGKG